MDFLKTLGELAEVVGEPDNSDSPVPYYLRTSLPNVNLILSNDQNLGVPGGRIITIAGPESSGKTALATELMAQAQQMGGFAFFEDFEHAFFGPHANALGLRTNAAAGDPWHYKKPAIAEEAFDRAYKLLRHVRASELGIKLPANTDKNPRAAADALRAAIRKCDLTKLIPIVGTMDSVASMTPAAQDIEYTKQNMKTKNMEMGAFMSIELKRLARDAEEAAATIILLNQLRTNPGVMFGDNKTEPGGDALKFYATLQLRLRRVSKWHMDYDDTKSEVIGDVVELYVRKNKIARPFRKTKYVFRTIDPVGLDVVGTMILLGKEAGVLGPTGGKTVEFDGRKRWGIRDFEAACYADADLKQRLIDHVMKTVDTISAGPVASDEEGGIPLVAAPADPFAT